MYNHWHFIDSSQDLVSAYQGSHNPWLVSLSIAIAVVAAYGALTQASRLTLMDDPRQRRIWLGLGALSMGGGIWTMHFIGMISYKLPVAVGYDLGWTLASILPAVVASAVALSVIGRKQLDQSRLIAGGTLMGAGIGTMHYVGMGAMRGEFAMAYEPGLFALSVVVAVALALLALTVRQAISRWEDGSRRQLSVLAGAVVMGGAVAGMHYTAMAAVHFWPNPATVIYGASGLVLVDPVVLGSIVSVAALLVTVVVVVSATTDRQWRNAQLLSREIEIRRNAEAALRQKNEALQRSMADLESFAYIASHDLREPLRAISCHLALLEGNLPEHLSSEHQDSLRFAVEGAKRLDRMVLDLLQYSQIGHAGGEGGFADTAAAVRAAIEENAGPIAESSARIDMAEDLPIIPGHKPDMVHLFSALIGNAIKYRVPGRAPHIRIWATREDGDWVFHVADNGIGIPDKYDYRQRIFRIFHRLHSVNDYGGGSGIGLAICKKIVDNHGGRIAVESDGDGKGSTFIVTLPAGL